MEKKYKALRLISSFTIFFGWIYIILGILAIFILLLSDNKVFTFKESVIIIIACIWSGLLSIGIGELINLFIDIEHNTRQSNIFENKIELVEKATSFHEENSEIDIKDADIYLLNQLIVGQKKKFIASKNPLIPDLLKRIVTDLSSGKSLALKYEVQFGKNLINDLISLSSSHDGLHFYVDPFIEVGFCDKQFPYKQIA